MPTTRKCAGVTTFIKTELIADGVGRAHVPRIGGQRNGMINGQKVDYELREWVNRGGRGPLKLKGSRHVAAGLLRLKIKPLKAQVRVTDSKLALTTLIDAVGEGPNNTLWVIEVKTTTLTTANHIKSYTRTCKRTPTMRNGLAHNEQNTHFLQAAFGALSIRDVYSIPHTIKIRACVIVATSDGCRTYTCPDSFFDWALFRRRAPVALCNKVKAYNQRGGRPNKLIGTISKVQHWPDPGSPTEKKIDRALRQIKLERVPGRKKMIWTVRRIGLRKSQGKAPKPGLPIGVVTFTSSTLHGMAAPVRAAVASKLTTAAKRLLLTNANMKAAARLIIDAQSFAVAPCPGPLARF